MQGANTDYNEAISRTGDQQMLEEFDAKFPGFEHEIHGITHVKDTETGRERYSLDILV